jgi:hypothetical protein
MKLNVNLNDEVTRRFQAIKQNSGFTVNTSVVNMLICKEYQRIERSKVCKVFLPRDVYRLVEQAAEKRGQTIYEYVQEITEDLLKQKPAS